MEVNEIAAEYQFIFNRLRKLEKSIHSIAHQNTQLKEANNKLRLEHDTWQNREAARERVISELINRQSETVFIEATGDGIKESNSSI